MSNPLQSLNGPIVDIPPPVRANDPSGGPDTTPDHDKAIFARICKDYLPPNFTKVEVLALRDDGRAMDELIAELNREYGQEK